MLGAQNPEDDDFDYDDEDDLRTPDLHTTVAETAVPQGDINHSSSLHPVALVNPALENGLPLASTSEQAISEADALINNSSPQNDLAISAISSLPITDAHTTITCAHTATTQTIDDGATHVHTAEEAHNSELQPTLSEPINADSDDAPIHGLNESQLAINPLGSQSAGRLDGENTHLQNDSVLASPVLYTPSTTRSSTPALSYIDSDDEDPDAVTQHSQIHLSNNVPIPHTTLDPDVLIEHDGPPIISRPSTPAPEPLTLVFLDGSQLESLLNRSLDYPQTTKDPNILIEHDRLPIISRLSTPPLTQNFLDASQLESSPGHSFDHSQTMPVVDSWQITEDEEVLEPPRLPAAEPAAQTMIDSWQILTTETEEALEQPHFPASEPAAGDTYFAANEGR